MWASIGLISMFSGLLLGLLWSVGFKPVICVATLLVTLPALGFCLYEVWRDQKGGN
jgi:hypothetical protein